MTDRAGTMQHGAITWLAGRVCRALHRPYRDGDGMESVRMERDIKDLILSAGAMRRRMEFMNDADPFRVVIEARAEIVEAPEEWRLTTAEVGKEDFGDGDYLIIKSVFVTSQPFRNDNRDSFRPEDLAEVGASTQISNARPGILDLNHDFFPYGVVLDKKAVQARVEVAGEATPVTQLEVYSVLWAWRFPELAAAVKKWHQDGKLRFSMACRASAYQCGDCGATAKETGEFCEHLLQGTYSERVLIKPKFYANSIITPNKQPADRNAAAKELAETNEELRWALRSAMAGVYDEMWRSIRDAINTGKNVVANVKRAFDAGKEGYLKLFEQLRVIETAGGATPGSPGDGSVAGTRVYEVTLEKARARADFESLPWLLFSVLNDIEHSGIEDGAEYAARAFDDGRDLFVQLWKAMSAEQREMYRNQKVVVAGAVANGSAGSTGGIGTGGYPPAPLVRGDGLENNLPEGDWEMDEKQIQALKEKLALAEARVKELEGAEAQKELSAAKKEVETLTALLSTADQEGAAMKGQLEAAQKDAETLRAEKDALEKELAEARAFVKAERERQAERTNAERKAMIEAMPLADDKKAFWIAKFSVAIDEGGNFCDPNGEIYAEFVQHGPAPAATPPAEDPVALSRQNSGLHAAPGNANGAIFSTMA